MKTAVKAVKKAAKTTVKAVKTAVKEVKKATKEAVKVYQSLEKMEPLKITKDMSDKEKCLRAGYNLSLITAQKSKGRFDATVDVWKGIYGELIEFVANPPRYIIESAKETGKGIGNIVLHPVQTTTAIKDSVIDAIDSYEKDVINGNAYSKSYWETKTKLNVIKEFYGRKGTGLLNDIPNSKNGIKSDSKQPNPSKDPKKSEETEGTGNASRQKQTEVAKDFAREQLDEHVKFLKNGGVKKPIDENGYGGGK